MILRLKSSVNVGKTDQHGFCEVDLDVVIVVVVRQLAVDAVGPAQGPHGRALLHLGLPE